MNIAILIVAGIMAVFIGMLIKRISQSPIPSYLPEYGFAGPDVSGPPVFVGLEGSRGEFIPLIQLGAGAAQTQKYNFTTTEEGQKEIKFKLYKGSGQSVRENEFIGSFTVSEIPPGPPGSKRVKVEFGIADGRSLEVKAYDLETERELPVYRAMI